MQPHDSTHTVVRYDCPTPLTTPEIVQGLRHNQVELRRRITRQGGVHSFFDNVLNVLLSSALKQDGSLGDDLAGRTPLSANSEYLLALLRRQKAGRFVDYFARKAIGGCDIPLPVLYMSQGVSDYIVWKDRTLFKTVFDLAIYQSLINDLRPKTVIEIGSGQGGSAVWVRDLLYSQGIEGHVYSLDIKPVPPAGDGVTFILADCNKIESAFAPDTLTQWPKPWLVIEDAHVNVTGVLGFFSNYLSDGDYLVIEDSLRKEDSIGKFLLHNRTRFRVDTRYTDLFGHNATSAFDSILRVMPG